MKPNMAPTAPDFWPARSMLRSIASNPVCAPSEASSVRPARRSLSSTLRPARNGPIGTAARARAVADRIGTPLLSANAVSRAHDAISRAWMTGPMTGSP